MTLSVVIPTLDRAPLLRRVLDRLDRQTADAFEVVIGVNAADRDIGAVRAAGEGRPYPVRVVQAAAPGVSAGRNRAWREASGSVVLFIGDDMLPAPDLVERHLDHHRRDPRPESGLIGHVRWARELEPTPFMAWLDRGVQFDFGSIPDDGPRWWHFVTANGSLKRTLLERVGGFDERFLFGYEDTDLGIRLHAAGLQLHYDPHAEVEHLHPPTLAGWQERMRAVARAERQFVAKHPGIEPYFLARFERAAAAPRMRRPVVGLSRIVPQRMPWLGPRARLAAELFYAQQLAPAFLQAWEEAGRDQPSGSPPGGPK
jgi:GT2 family glycosyltransferase